VEQTPPGGGYVSEMILGCWIPSGRNARVDRRVGTGVLGRAVRIGVAVARSLAGLHRCRVMISRHQLVPLSATLPSWNRSSRETRPCCRRCRAFIGWNPPLSSDHWPSLVGPAVGDTTESGFLPPDAACLAPRASECPVAVLCLCVAGPAWCPGF
jgi:hypothetical protein